MQEEENLAKKYMNDTFYKEIYLPSLTVGSKWIILNIGVFTQVKQTEAVINEINSIRHQFGSGTVIIIGSSKRLNDKIRNDYAKANHESLVINNSEMVEIRISPDYWFSVEFYSKNCPRFTKGSAADFIIYYVT